jgi:hypothetical protein
MFLWIYQGSNLIDDRRYRGPDAPTASAVPNKDPESQVAFNRSSKSAGSTPLSPALPTFPDIASGNTTFIVTSPKPHLSAI